MNSFLVNDYNNYYDVEMSDDGTYTIVNTININGNEEFIKDLQERRRISYANTRTRSISGLANSVERVGEFDDRNNVTTEREQTWTEYADEILEKFKSGRADRIDDSIEGEENNQRNQYSLSDETSSKDGVFFDAKKGSDIRFSLADTVEETKDLITVHNLNSSELSKTLELGGLPMPSVAVIKAQDGHEMYGDVTLILPKETIDPKASKANKVYGGDAWTPTYPKIEYKPNAKVEKKVRDKYYDFAKEHRNQA